MRRAKQRGEERQQMRRLLGAENRPPDHDDEQRDRGRYRAATSSERFAQKQAVERQEQSVVGAPQHEIPARAMPKSGGEKANPEIDVGLKLAAAIAAERHIEIVADPGGERDVPASPKVRQRLRDVGGVEVFLQRE